MYYNDDTSLKFCIPFSLTCRVLLSRIVAQFAFLLVVLYQLPHLFACPHKNTATNKSPAMPSEMYFYSWAVREGERDREGSYCGELQAVNRMLQNQLAFENCTPLSLVAFRLSRISPAPAPLPHLPLPHCVPFFLV